MARPIIPVVDRFMRHVSPEPNSGCWLWTGGLQNHGYGSFWFRGRTDSAHRVAYVLYRGEIPAGLRVLHSCDNVACVNPDHLWIGTQFDNVMDMIKKDRGAKSRLGRMFGSERQPTGKFRAGFWDGQKMVRVGMFNTEVEASNAATYGRNRRLAGLAK